MEQSSLAGPVTEGRWRMGGLERPGKVVCVGRNYREHADELGHTLTPEPLLFLKPPSSVIGDGDAIVLPRLPAPLGRARSLRRARPGDGEDGYQGADGVPLRAPQAQVTEEGMSVSSPAAAVHAVHTPVVEDVLCIPRTTIFPGTVWHGLVTRGLERVLRTIRAASEYRPRHLVEDDPTQQQVIPYCIVHQPDDDTYLITRRLRCSSERRLHNLYSLGVGGHVNPGDGERLDPVVGGLIREWRRRSSARRRRRRGWSPCSTMTPPRWAASISAWSSSSSPNQARCRCGRSRSWRGRR